MVSKQFLFIVGFDHMLLQVMIQLLDVQVLQSMFESGSILQLSV